jgi:hypothetical protein
MNDAACAGTIPPMRLCRLQYTLGRVEDCSEEACPFWEPGGAVLEGRCAFDELDVADQPAAASWLLRTRKRLEAAQLVEEDPRARRLFRRLSARRARS